MANHSATKKDIRKTKKRTALNQTRKSRVKTFLKKVEIAIAEGKKDVAKEALRVAQSEMTKSVKHNVFKLNTASRKISRLSSRIKAIS